LGKVGKPGKVFRQVAEKKNFLWATLNNTIISREINTEFFALLFVEKKIPIQKFFCIYNKTQ